MGQRAAIPKGDGQRMSGGRHRFRRPPIAIRRAKLDNLAIVPASLLPFKAKWQEIANNLPEGDTLIVFPTSDSPSRKTLHKVTLLLKAKGQRVTTIPAEAFG